MMQCPILHSSLAPSSGRIAKTRAILLTVLIFSVILENKTVRALTPSPTSSVWGFAGGGGPSLAPTSDVFASDRHGKKKKKKIKKRKKSGTIHSALKATVEGGSSDDNIQLDSKPVIAAKKKVKKVKKKRKHRVEPPSPDLDTSMETDISRTKREDSLVSDEIGAERELLSRPTPVPGRKKKRKKKKSVKGTPSQQLPEDAQAAVSSHKKKRRKKRKQVPGVFPEEDSVSRDESGVRVVRDSPKEVLQVGETKIEADSTNAIKKKKKRKKRHKAKMAPTSGELPTAINEMVIDDREDLIAEKRTKHKKMKKKKKRKRTPLQESSATVEKEEVAAEVSVKTSAFETIELPSAGAKDLEGGGSEVVSVVIEDGDLTGQDKSAETTAVADQMVLLSPDEEKKDTTENILDSRAAVEDANFGGERENVYGYGPLDDFPTS